MAPQSRNWVFTLNNPTQADEEALKTHLAVGAFAYLAYQKEVGDSNTPHLQGYVQLPRKGRLGGLKTLIPRAHLQIRAGTHDQAVHYCSKPHEGCDCKHCVSARGLPNDGRAIGASPVVLGTPTGGAGQRNDLLDVRDALDGGMAMADVAHDFFGAFCRHHRAFREYVVLRRAGERDWHTKCQVYWGPPGTGKSRRAMHEAGPGAYWLSKPQGNGTVWFDGYDGQETVVMDEFYGWISRDLMQRMCDRYPLLVQTKGGTVPFLAKRIIVTSNQEPANWWRNIGLGAMQRRLEGDLGNIEEMADEWVPPQADDQPDPDMQDDVDIVDTAPAPAALEDSGDVATGPFGPVEAAEMQRERSVDLFTDSEDDPLLYDSDMDLMAVRAEIQANQQRRGEWPTAGDVACYACRETFAEGQTTEQHTCGGGRA